MSLVTDWGLLALQLSQAGVPAGPVLLGSFPNHSLVMITLHTPRMNDKQRKKQATVLE